MTTLKRSFRGLLAMALAASVCQACGAKKPDSKAKKQTGAPATMNAEKSATKKTASSKTHWVRKPMPKMGLTILVPSDAKVEETKQDAWNADVNDSDYKFKIRVATVTGAYGSFATQVKESEGHHSLKFIKWNVKTKTKGGFHLQCEHKNDDGKTHHMVLIRYTLGTQQFQCFERTTESKKLPGILKACLSVAAAKK